MRAELRTRPDSPALVIELARSGFDQWYEYQEQKAQWLADKRFVCNVYGCGRGFGSLQALEDHCWVCNTSELEQAEQWLALTPFTCSRCHAGCKDATPGCHTRSFRTQDGLDSHMASCGKTELMLNLEAALWLKDLKETRYQCDWCKKDKPNKFFLTKDALSQHEEVCGKSQEDLHRDCMAYNKAALCQSDAKKPLCMDGRFWSKLPKKAEKTDTEDTTDKKLANLIKTNVKLDFSMTMTMPDKKTTVEAPEMNCGIPVYTNPNKLAQYTQLPALEDLINF